MRNAIKTVGLAMVLGAGIALAGTQEEIDHLLDYVETTRCTYERNGVIHDGPEAREHINRKYQHYRKKIKTAEDFIKYSATKSMISGKKYVIHCAGSEDEFAGDWLLEELRVYRNSHKNPDGS